MSRFVQREASEYLNVETIKVIYNGVDTKKFSIDPSEKSKKLINLITISALEKRKGIQHVIRALKQINKLVLGDKLSTEEKVISLMRYYELNQELYKTNSRK